MRNIVLTWEKKAFSSEEQVVEPTTHVGEAELTDEQLETVCGGYWHDDWDPGYDDRWHDDDDRWRHHDRDWWWHHDR
jgi:hypothetical protein